MNGGAIPGERRRPAAVAARPALAADRPLRPSPPWGVGGTPSSVEAALRVATARLAAAAIDDPRREARLLLAHATGRDGAFLRAHGDEPLATDGRHRFFALVARRARRVPMAQVLGRCGFRHLDLRVSPATLTPRPESETVVETALALFAGPAPPPGLAGRVCAGRPPQNAAARPPASLLDLGTGSGCLLIALLDLWPQSRGMGIDLSGRALAVARANARACGVADRARFAVGDWLEGVRQRFDLVVCNPPYVASGDLPGLEPEVACHEPRLALDGGGDGLDGYRRILPRLAGVLAPGGIAVFEHGAGQGPALERLAAARSLAAVVRVRDLAGRRRCLALRSARAGARHLRGEGKAGRAR